MEHTEVKHLLFYYGLLILSDLLHPSMLFLFHMKTYVQNVELYILSAPIEDPYLIKDIQALEKVQRRAVCWVLFSDYSRSTSESTMHNHLGWSTLVEHSVYAKIVYYLSTPKKHHIILPSHTPISPTTLCDSSHKN